MQSSVRPENSGRPSTAPTSLDSARHWTKLGFFVVPIPSETKKPVIKGWPDLRLTEEDLPKHFPADEPRNVGILLGVNGAADVDMDCVEAIHAGRELLPPTGIIFGRNSKPASHRVYRLPEAVPSKQYEDPVDGKMIVELRCLKQDSKVGLQTVVPHSVHQSGEAVRFWSDGAPAEIEGEALRSTVDLVAAAALLAKYWPESGRNKTELALAGAIAHVFGSRGLPVEEAIRFVLAVYRSVPSHDPSAVERVANSVRNSFENYEADRPVTGIPTLKECLVTSKVDATQAALIVDAAFEWMGYRGWPAPKPIIQPLPRVPKLELTMLPEVYRPFCADLAELMSVPAEAPAGALLTIIAGCIGRRASVQPKKHDDSWTEFGNLYGANVTKIGRVKSPVQDMVSAPLIEVDRALYAEFKEESEKYEAAMAIWNAANKKKERGDRPEKPVAKQHYVSEATWEAAMVAVANNPCGILVLKDELAGMFEMFQKDGREGERSFYLSAWSGRTPFKIDRIIRGITYVEHLCLSLYGSIQPGPFQDLVRSVETNSSKNDGFIQRLQILFWPEQDSKRKVVDRKPEYEAREAIVKLQKRLLALPEEALRLKMAPDAQELMMAWLQKNFDLIDSGEFQGLMAAHMSKYSKLISALALQFELVDWIATDQGRNCISLDHLKQAIELAELLELHARKALGCWIPPAEKARFALAEAIRKKEIVGPFKCRDLRRSKLFRSSKDEREAQGAIDDLVDAGWLRAVKKVSGPKGGHPIVEYEVNPDLDSLEESEPEVLELPNRWKDWTPSEVASAEAAAMPLVSFDEVSKKREIPSDRSDAVDSSTDDGLFDGLLDDDLAEKEK